ncbi:MAG: DUF4389 domain-containing protein [Nanoarchaeota archaeon]
MGERKEVFMRIVVGIISGIVLGVWRYFIFVLVILNWFYTLFSGKRNKELAKLCEIWNTQAYTYIRYLGFVVNDRPFPFEKLTKNISKFKK